MLVVLLFAFLFLQYGHAQTNPGFRFVNLSEQQVSIDYYISGVPIPLIRKVSPGTATGVRTEFPPGFYEFEVRRSGDSTAPPLATIQVQAQSGYWYSICYTDVGTQPFLFVLEWDTQRPQLTNVRLRFAVLYAEMPFPSTITLQHNPFILNLPYQEVSEFVEVPIQQAQTVGLINAQTMEEEAIFGGNFEGNNVYAVLFIQRGTDFFAIVLNESQQDEQRPLLEMRKLTYRFVARLLNFYDNYALVLRQRGLAENLLSVGALFSSEMKEITIWSDSLLAVYKASDLQNPLGLLQNFRVEPYREYFFAAAPIGAAHALIALPYDSHYFEIPENFSIRCVNFYAAAAALDVQIVLSQQTIALDSIPQGGFSPWATFLREDFQLRISNHQTKEIIAEIAVPITHFQGGRVTLYLLSDANGKLRVFYLPNELFDPGRIPITELKIQNEVEARYRLAHFGLIDRPVAVVLNGEDIAQQLEFAQATAVVQPVPDTDLRVELQFPGEDSTLLTIPVSVQPEQYYLSVVWGNLEDATFTSPLKIGDGTDSFIRFLHCSSSQQQNILTVQLPDNRSLRVDYRSGTDFVPAPFENELLEFSVENGEGVRWTYQITAQQNRKIYSVIFVDNQNGEFSAYLLFEEVNNQLLLEPLIPLSVTGIAEGYYADGFHVVGGNEYIRVDVPDAVHQWTVMLYDLVGRRLWSSSGSRRAIMIETHRWRRGVYWIVIIDHGGAMQWEKVYIR